MGRTVIYFRFRQSRDPLRKRSRLLADPRMRSELANRDAQCCETVVIWLGPYTCIIHTASPLLNERSIATDFSTYELPCSHVRIQLPGRTKNQLPRRTCAWADPDRGGGGPVVRTPPDPPPPALPGYGPKPC